MGEAGLGGNGDQALPTQPPELEVCARNPEADCTDFSTEQGLHGQIDQNQ